MQKSVFSRGYNGIKVEPMTVKQSDTVEWIEEVVEVRYDGGNNKYEASKFIDEYIKLTKEMSEYNERVRY